MRQPFLSALVLVLVLVLVAGSLAADPARTLTVTGEDDPAVDRPAIQAAVDAARPGDTVELDGTFQLDGTPIFVSTSRLTIAGAAVDDDGDGAVNEDPVDGFDDDGDGLVDEDDWNAVLVGVDDGFGGPARDAFPARFNDGIEVLGFDAALDGIVIRDLAFRRLNRSIYLFPDYDDGGTVLLCSASAPTAGSLDRVAVEGNAFDNAFRGVELLGRVTGLSVRDNRFTGIRGQAVLLFGQEIGCAGADGGIEDFLPLGTPTRTVISGNELRGVTIGLLSFISAETAATRNGLVGAGFGLVSIEDEKISLAQNDVSNATIGLLASFDPRIAGPALGNSLANNRVTDSLFGLLIDCDTTGYTAVNNEFAGSFLVDVLLDGTAPGGFCGFAGLGDSFDNAVIATDFVTTVLDFGVGNRLLGTLAMTENPGVPDEVRDLLAAMRADLGKP